MGDINNKFKTQDYDINLQWLIQNFIKKWNTKKNINIINLIKIFYLLNIS